MASGDYDGRLVVGHVFWVRDLNNEWHPIATLRGQEGAKGERGEVFIPKVDADGNISWALREFDGQLPATQNIRGPQGVQGERGPQGERGATGEKGEKGDPGEDTYTAAKRNGYEGTAAEFYEALAKTVQTKELAEEAHDLAMQNNHAHVFQTKTEHDAWMGDPQMRQLLNVGDYIVIKESGERFYWDGNTEQSFDPVIGEEPVTADIAGGDNWGTSWGFDLDLKSVNPEAWEGQPYGAVAKVSNVGLQVSGRAGTNDRVWLELTGADGKVWTSTDTPSWKNSGSAVDYTFDPPAELPGGTMAARFVRTDGSGAGHAMPMRISKVSATETPAGCDVWTADAGTAKRTDFAPRIRNTYYTLPTTETVAMALDSLEERKLDKSGGTVTGILRMKNPKVAADDDPAHDIAVVPNAGGQGLQVQFPGGDTVILPVKRGTVATTEDVDSKIAVHNASEDAHEDIREKLADKADKTELAETAEGLLRFGEVFADYVFTLKDATGKEVRFAFGGIQDSVMIDITAQNVGTGYNIYQATEVDARIRSEASTREQGDAATLSSAKAYADGKQDKLVAGEGIVIGEDGKTISATGGGEGNVTYDALSAGFSVSVGDKSFGLTEGFDDARIVNLSFDNSFGSNVGKSLATKDYVDEAGQAFLNKTDVDGALSDTSENPVQNKVVKSALDEKYIYVNTGSPDDFSFGTPDRNILFTPGSNGKASDDLHVSVFTDEGNYYLELPTVTAMEAALAKKQDKLTAGTNITLTVQADGTVKIDAAGGGGWDPTSATDVAIGQGAATASYGDSVAVGKGANTSAGGGAVAIGFGAKSLEGSSVSVGMNAQANMNSVALGNNASAGTNAVAIGKGASALAGQIVLQAGDATQDQTVSLSVSSAGLHVTIGSESVTLSMAKLKELAS